MKENVTYDVYYGRERLFLGTCISDSKFFSPGPLVKSIARKEFGNRWTHASWVMTKGRSGMVWGVSQRAMTKLIGPSAVLLKLEKVHEQARKDKKKAKSILEGGTNVKKASNQGR